MLTIEIKEDPDDPKERARRAAAKRKQKEAEAALANNKSKLPVTFWLRQGAQEMLIFVRSSVRPSGLNLSKALNLHLLTS